MILLLSWLALAAEPLRYEELRGRVLDLGNAPLMADYALDQVTAALAARKRAWDPDLSYSAAFRVSMGQGGFSSVATAGLKSTIEIYNGGANRALLQQAEAATEAAQATIQVEHQQVLWDLGAGLLLVAEARTAVKLEESRLQREQATLTWIQALVTAGTRNRADALQQEATVADAEAGLIAARQSANDAERAMLLLLRLDPLKSWDLPVPAGFSTLSGSPAELVDLALRQRPELQVSEALVRQAEAAVAQEKSGLRPQVDGSLGVDGSLDPAAPANAAAQATAALTLSGAILDRHGTRSAVAQADAALKMSLERLDAVRWSIRGQVLQAVGHREAAGSAVAATQRQLAASTEALRIVEARYTAGAALFTELSAARFAVVQAERAQVAADSAVAQAEWELRWAVGEEL